jgi:Flp pilus assembly protein TadB
MFQNPMGLMLLGVAGGMMLMGGIIIKKMLEIDL